VVTFVTQLTTLGLHTVSTVVLARLLTPQDYGLVAMVLVFTMFAKRFQDLGLSSATIQKDGLTHDQVSTIFWLNVAVGAGLSITVAAIAPALAWFYQREAVLWITLASSANFLIASLGAQHAVLLKREMRFGALAGRQIVSSALGLSVSIVMALQGFGYWALVVGELTTATAGTLLLWKNSGWRPGPPRRGAGVRRLVRFGANVTGFEMTNYFSRNADKLLIGRVWGADALGIYGRAYSLLMLPINNLRGPLNDVAFPVLSQLRHDAPRYREYFSRYQSLLAFASMPLAAFLFISAGPLIAVALGARWAESARIFSVLAVTGFVQPTAATRGLVLMSTGQDARYLRLGIWNAVVYGAAFVIGVPWGAVGVAAAYGVATYAMLYPSLQYSYRHTPVPVSDFFKAIARPAVASIAAAGLALVIGRTASASSDLIKLTVYAAVFLPSYLIVFLVLPGGRAELREYLSFRNYFRRDAASAQKDPTSI
jgi:PST family polysaccharide transporter